MTDKKTVQPGKPYSGGIKAGNQIFISGQVATDDEGNPIGETVGEQTRIVLEKIKTILDEFGAHLSDLVRCTVYLPNVDAYQELNKAYIAFFEENGISDGFPTRAAVPTRELPNPKWLVEIDGIAVVFDE